MKSHSGCIRFFSDEKVFNVDRSFNCQNDRYLASDASEVPHVATTKHPASVMVLGVISSKGHVMPPVFFPQGLRLNNEGYMKVLVENVMPWMKTMAMGDPIVFQQDSAPCHKHKKVVAFLKGEIDHFWTPDQWVMATNRDDFN